MADFTLMGILNVTPDSFSDGGRFMEAAVAVAHARAMVDAGAGMIDVGGESTRPGAQPVSASEELRRVLPVIEALAQELPGVTISVDTTKAAVADAAIAAGARYVNDVTGLTSDPEMAAVVNAHPDVRCCVMHMQGEPRTMQEAPHYVDVVEEVAGYLAGRVDELEAAGIAPDRIDIDPGFGFGKSPAHNLQLLRHIDRFVALGQPVLLGTSRKSTLRHLTGRVDPSELVAASVSTAVLAYERGVRAFRVHDVAAHRDALIVAHATLNA